MKLWGGRMSRPTDQLVHQLNASFSFDVRLYREDILGSQAWARALAQAGVITSKETKQIVDGLSMTLIVGERATKKHDHDHDPHHGKEHDDESGPKRYYSTWVGVFPDAEHAPARVIGVSHTPPNFDSDHPHNFSSYHPAGANFLLGDGSVRMISDAIPERIYHALCTRAGHDISEETCLDP